MALTVRPDDEVYQFDTVWLGPDEYTLPIQARYVAWGTWLACFLVAAVLIIPLGGGGPRAPAPVAAGAVQRRGSGGDALPPPR
jgi:hypothetical protein